MKCTFNFRQLKPTWNTWSAFLHSDSWLPPEFANGVDSEWRYPTWHHFRHFSKNTFLQIIVLLPIIIDGIAIRQKQVTHIALSPFSVPLPPPLSSNALNNLAWHESKGNENLSDHEEREGTLDSELVSWVSLFSVDRNLLHSPAKEFSNPWRPETVQKVDPDWSTSGKAGKPKP